MFYHRVLTGSVKLEIQKRLFNGDSMVALSGDCKVNPCGMQNGQYRLVAESEIMAAKCLV